MNGFPHPATNSACICGPIEACPGAGWCGSLAAPPCASPWALLPFLLGTLGAIWWALERSYRDAEIIEDLTLTPTQITLTRHGPKGQRQDWQANPYWVKVQLYPKGGPVPDYLTLYGDGREVELGAFLSQEERSILALELRQKLAANPPA
jgi:uncharacterized membrane protein